MSRLGRLRPNRAVLVRTAAVVAIVTGTAAGSLGGAQGAAAATRVAAAQVAGAIGGTSGTATGTRGAVGVAVGALGGPQGAAAGLRTTTGIAAGSPGGASGTAPGVRVALGVAAGQLGGATGQGSGGGAIGGTAAGDSGGAQGVGTGLRTVFGAAASTLGGAGGAGSGSTPGAGGASYRLWPATDGPGSQASDTDNYTLAVEFYVTTAADLTHVHFWASAELAGSDHACRVWSVNSGGASGVVVSGGDATFPSPLQAGWNTATLAAPVALIPGQRYRAGVYFTTDNGFTATNEYWMLTGPGGAGIAAGPLVAPGAIDVPDERQNSFNAGSPGSYPNGSFNGGNYWVDVTVQTGESAPVAAGSLGGAGGTATGTRVVGGAAAGSLGGTQGASTGAGVEQSRRPAVLIVADHSATRARHAHTPQALIVIPPVTENVIAARGSLGGASGVATGRRTVFGTAAGSLGGAIGDSGGDPPTTPGGEYRLWPATDGPGAQANDGDDYTLAVEFRVTQPGCTLTKIHIWAAQTFGVATDHVTRLYQVGNSTPIADGSATFTSPLVAGWNTVTLATPVDLTEDTAYLACVYFTTDNGYTATGTYWSTGAGAAGITNGPLSAPANGAQAGPSQGAFRVGADAIPNAGFGAGNYWIDVTVQTSAGGGTTTVDGAAAGSIGGASGVAVATRRTLGEATGNVGGASGASAGTRRVVASAAGSLGGCAGAGVGAGSNVGSAAAALGGATGAATGTRVAVGLAGGTLGGGSGTAGDAQTPPAQLLVGTIPVTAFHVGAAPVVAVYRGSTLLWTA